MKPINKVMSPPEISRVMLGSPPFVYGDETGGWLAVRAFMIAIKEHDTLFRRIMSSEREMVQNSHGGGEQNLSWQIQG